MRSLTAWPVDRRGRVRAALLAGLVASLGATSFISVTSDREPDPVVAADASGKPDPRGNRSELDPGRTEAWTGRTVAVHSSERSFTETVRITAADEGITLDPVEVQCHGGVVDAWWYVGNLEPVEPTTGIHLSLRMNGDVISSALVGSTDGVWNDQPVTIRALVGCPAGRQRFDLLVHGISGGWGIPYVQNVGDLNAGLVVRRGLTVRETYEPSG